MRVGAKRGTAVSESLASLRRKIDGARDLRSVVSTMKALAAASIGQYEKSVRALEDYYHTVQLGLSACLRADMPSSPMLPVDGQKIKQGTGVTGAVIFGSDQGLVGQFNDTVTDYAVQALTALPGRKKIWAVGGRVHDRLADRNLREDLQVAGFFPVPLSVKGITPLVGQILMEIVVPGLEEGKAQKRKGGRNRLVQLYLFYNSTRPETLHDPLHRRLLPLDETWRRELAAIPWPAKCLPEVMGGSAATLHALIREYLFVSLFRACAESLASENASRLAAMERAEKNIDQLSADLRQTFHRLRQSRIDEELFDVIAGVEALAGASRAARGQGDGWD
jgi:F-type H+-transporting ATPase subunit gamma